LIFYLTFNDAPSGIYSSQVIDVVKYFNNVLNQKTNLVAFISLRGFFDNRKKIKNELSDAFVIPMFPGVHRWRWNTLILKFLVLMVQPKAIIGRSVLATQMAMKVKGSKRKIVYDGRGAIAAEWREYGVITNTNMLNEIDVLERDCVLKSDFRIAVSHQLIKYWQTKFNYDTNEYVVIPCTLNKVFESIDINEKAIDKARKVIGFEVSDVVLVYSGSIAGWQSFDLLYQFVKPFLEERHTHKLLFLSGKDASIDKLMDLFPKQVVCKKVDPIDVPNYLIAADYGLLIREKSITNKVASPVKFAEYLACGLNVIISEDLGDYTEFVLKNNCGFVLSEIVKLDIGSIILEKKLNNQILAMQYFFKAASMNAIAYQNILSSLSI
jgi:hypothetical protein